jgi:hypothetical protein
MVDQQVEIVKNETFAPILYVMRYSEIGEAIRLQNDVPKGLSSSIFTKSRSWSWSRFRRATSKRRASPSPCRSPAAHRADGGACGVLRRRSRMRDRCGAPGDCPGSAVGRRGLIIVRAGSILAVPELAALDVLRCAAEGEVRKVRLTSRVPRKSLIHEPYVLEQGFDFRDKRPAEPAKVFVGTAGEAALHFPRGLNVAAAVSLAGIGFVTPSILAALRQPLGS